VVAGTDTEHDGLKALVERNRRELEEMRRELEEIGEELRQEHIRRAREDRSSSNDGNAEVNRMCRECLNSCKQPSSVTIHRCDRYDPVK